MIERKFNFLFAGAGTDSFSYFRLATSMSMRACNFPRLFLPGEILSAVSQR